MTNDLAHIIATVRRFRGLTQQQVADRLPNTSRALVATWEAGRSIPSEAQLIRLAEVLGVGLENLLPSTPAIPARYDLTALARRLVDAGVNFCEELSQLLRMGAFAPIIREVQEVKDIVSHRRRGYDVEGWEHDLDHYAHDRFLALVEDEILPLFADGLILVSEESIDQDGRIRPIHLPGASEENGDGQGHPQAYVIVDPIDRTIEAVRATTGFASITIGTFANGPLVSAVFPLFDRYASCYYAITGNGARVTFRDGTSEPLSPSEAGELRGSCLAAYIGRPSRLSALTTHADLFRRHGSESAFVNASGCYGFCLVASSQVDAFFEVAKGYAWHDIVSGAHILREAGGVVKGLDFNDLADPLAKDASKGERDFTASGRLRQITDALSYPAEDPAEAGRRLRRFTFIAAGTYDLAAKIAIELARS